MAIGGYSWTDHRAKEDWGLTSGVDPDKMYAKWFTIRLRFEGDVLREVMSAAPHVYVPNEVLEQKLALLKVAPVGSKVPGLGWHRGKGLFYLRIYEDDLGFSGV
jgi:hypothetical protein